MITKDEVLALMHPLNVIGLIKEYRESTRNGSSVLGLKECKDAIEKALMVPLSGEQAREYANDPCAFRRDPINYTNEQIDKRYWQVLSLFGLTDPASKVEIMKEMRMKKALNFAIDNWEVMGFSSAVNAAKTIVDNF